MPSGKNKAQRRSKEVRLADIAQMANVSIATVSMALARNPAISEETQRRVLQVSEQLNYRPLNVVTAGVRKRVGYLVIDIRNDDPSYALMLKHLSCLLTSQGRRLEFASLMYSQDVNTLLAQALQFAEGMGGVLLSGWLDSHFLSLFRKRGIPSVVMGHYIPDQEEPSPLPVTKVCSDEVEMGRQATAYLLSHGHRRIAFGCGSIPEGMCHSRWLRGYRLALAEAGFLPKPEWVQTGANTEGGPERMVDTWTELREPPTAYVIPDIDLAVRLRTVLLRRHITIEPQNMVLSGNDQSSRLFDFTGHPMILEQADLIGGMALAELDRMIVAPDRQPCAMVVPHAIVGMSHTEA